MDVIIFGGQSNMQGCTGSLPQENPPVQNAWEYRWKSGELIPLQHPVGEDVREEVWLAAASEMGGSLLPDFCRAYLRETGREVIAVHAAKGSTTIAEWLYGTQRYYYTVKKGLGAIQKAKDLGRLGHVYYVWLQGESDALIDTTEQEYLERLISLKNRLKKDLQIEKFGIIKVGHFFPASAREPGPLQEAHKKKNEAIMRAQSEAATIDSDFIMLTEVCPSLSLEREYINEKAPGHYNNAGMKIIGELAGKALADLCSNKG